MSKRHAHPGYDQPISASPFPNSRSEPEESRLLSDRDSDTHNKGYKKQGENLGTGNVPRLGIKGSMSPLSPKSLC